MANLKELRNRIGSIKNTRKITSAMSRIAAARLRRAQNAVTAARPYGVRLEHIVSELLHDIAPTDPLASHPLLAPREVKRIAIIVLTANRGLCGGFNSNVNRHVARMVLAERELGREVVLLAVGKKGRSFFEHRGFPLVETHEAPELDGLLERAAVISSKAIGLFTHGVPEQGGLPVDAVKLVYNRFVNVLSQEVTTIGLLPVAARESTSAGTYKPAPSFEPSRAELLDHLLPVAIESRIQQAMFDSIASEVAARRTAMDSATDNATQLIADLTIVYNRERQAAITKELMEIIGGAEALKG